MEAAQSMLVKLQTHTDASVGQALPPGGRKAHQLSSESKGMWQERGGRGGEEEEEEESPPDSSHAS